MQPSCLKDNIAQSLTQRFLLVVSEKYSTNKFVEYFPGEVMDIVGHCNWKVNHLGRRISQLLKLEQMSVETTLWHKSRFDITRNRSRCCPA